MSKPSLDSTGVPEEYWFNLQTRKVEFGKLTPSSFRIGPFATEAEAAQALETIAARNRAWDESEQSED